jgi:hypothetical protein
MLSVTRAGVWQGVVHSPTAWVFTFVLVVIFSVVDYLLYFRLKSTLGLYAWNILAEWALVAGCVCVIHRNGLRLVDIGESLGSPLRTLAALGLLLVVVAVFAIANKIRPQKASAEQKAKRQAKSGDCFR